MKHLLLFAAFSGALCAQTCEDITFPAGTSLAAVQDLQSKGADVRAWLIPSMGAYATLDAYERDAESRCASWRAPDGGRKNNLVVVLVAIQNRKTGIYYGSQWKPMLDGQWPRVQSQIMAPRFRDGNYPSGISAGLAEIGALITTRATTGGTVVVQSPSAPTDLSGLWSFMGWLLVAGVGAGLLIFAAVMLRRRQSEREDRTRAQQRALIAQQEATGVLADIQASELDVSQKAKFDAAVEAFSQLGYGPSDPSNPNLTTAQYEAQRERYASVAADLRSVRYGGATKAQKLWPVTSGPASHSTRKAAPPAAAQSAVHETVVHHHHEYVDPVFIPQPIIVQQPYAIPIFETPAYRAPDPPRHRDPDPPTSSWGSSSSDSGGGSSDWGSSSSSDSGGGSSDSGSSSCDSGGGSSDW